MWINCNDTIINLDKVNYISFEYSKNDSPSVVIHFTGTRSPLVIEAASMSELIDYFQSLTIGKENEQTVSKSNADS